MKKYTFRSMKRGFILSVIALAGTVAVVDSCKKKACSDNNSQSELKATEQTVAQPLQQNAPQSKIATIVNIFLQSNGLQLAVSYIGVAIFLGLTAYDIQKIKKLYAQFGSAGNLAVLGALSLYLDFLNLFLFLLRIFGSGRD